MASYKKVEEYLNLPYTIEVIRDDNPDDPGWVARIVELPGCITQGDTFEELGEMIEDAMRAWIEVSMEDGDTIPEPRPIEDYSGKFVTRVPRSLHRDLVQAADKEGVSLNAIVNVALARAVGQPSPTPATDHPPSTPAPVWTQLSPAAHRAMLIAGLEVEASQINEIMLSGWLENQLAQAHAALQTRHTQDALLHLHRVQQALSMCGQASPLMAVFAQTAQLLQQQITYIHQLQSGIIEQTMLQARIHTQVQGAIGQPEQIDQLFFQTSARPQSNQPILPESSKDIYDLIHRQK